MATPSTDEIQGTSAESFQRAGAWAVRNRRRTVLLELQDKWMALAMERAA